MCVSLFNTLTAYSIEETFFFLNVFSWYEQSFSPCFLLFKFMYFSCFTHSFKRTENNCISWFSCVIFPLPLQASSKTTSFKSLLYLTLLPFLIIVASLALFPTISPLQVTFVGLCTFLSVCLSPAFFWPYMVLFSDVVTAHSWTLTRFRCNAEWSWLRSCFKYRCCFSTNSYDVTMVECNDIHLLGHCTLVQAQMLVP